MKQGRPGLIVTRGKLSQWLYWEKNLLERSTGHILDVAVNANFIVFPIGQSDFLFLFI